MWSRFLQRNEQPASMDFSAIMNLASSNKSTAQESYKRKQNCKKKDGSGVSSAAVKSFLAKKKEEEQKRKDREEEERRKRIEVRLQQQSKGKQTKQTPAKNEKSEEKRKPEPTQTGFVEDIPKHPRNKVQRISRVTDQNTAKRPCIDNTKKRVEQIPAKNNTEKLSAGKKEQKPQKIARAGAVSSSSSVRSNVPSAKETVKVTPPSNVKKKITSKQQAPMNIQDILSMAAKNKGGIGSLPQKKPTVKPKVEEPVIGDGYYEPFSSKKRRKKAPDTTKDMAPKKECKPSQGVINGKGKAVTSRNADHVRQKNVTRNSTSLKRKGEDHRSAETRTSRNTAPSVVRQTLDVRTRYEKPNPYERHQLMGQMPPFAKKRKMQRYYEEDEDEGDLSDFIDDEPLDGGDVNVSDCIRQIFGYDKGKYKDEDDDLSSMEASYAQINKEEARSSKIAKLEDEIEHLKELEMLKKEKLRLKKKAKNK